jgi:hypothetical protein
MGLNEILISFFFSSRFSNRNPFLFLAILCLGMASDAPTLNHTLDVQWDLGWVLKARETITCTYF